MDKLFTFWEGPMPAYIDLCLRTWKRPFTLLTYDNLHEYTDIRIEQYLGFTLPQIADAVRVHVLRDQGGYWMDADTIMLTGKLPEATVLGNPETRTNSIGFLHSEPHSEMFTEWAKYQDEVIANPDASYHWSVMGNDFTDPYVREHMDITIGHIKNCCPETYMIKGNISRYEKYHQLYFDKKYHLSDLHDTDMLMLHNSWTPTWYKNMTADDVLAANYTLSNILSEVLRED